MSSILKSIRKKIGLFNLKRAFKKVSANISNLPLQMRPDELLNIAFSSQYDLIQPWQNKSEIIEVLRIIEKNPPKTVLEIGTANGGTFFLLSRMANENALIVSVDLPGGKFGGGYPSWKEKVYKSFAKGKQRIELLRANSHELQTFNKVKEIFGQHKIEFMFLDGDHTYEGVKQDMEMYKELLADEALVMFHDVVPHFNPIYGVEKFWNEIKRDYEHKEFIEDMKQDGKGLGLIMFKRKK